MNSTTPTPAGSPAASTSPGILCGTDFSPAAEAAAGVAARLARRLDVPLEVLHTETHALEPSVMERLEREAARLRATGATVRAELARGLADEQLVARAQPDRYRLLVVGALGGRTAGRWVLGSVAERAAERAAVPTLVTRAPEALAAWLRGERPLRVFVAFDFSRSSEAALAWVRELRELGPCTVITGFVFWPPEQRARLGGNGPLSLEGSSAEVLAMIQRDIHTRAAEVLGGGEFEVRAESNWGRQDVRLAEMAYEAGADLIVTGSHQYHGFERLWHGSVSRGLLHHAAMNVAVVPLAAGAGPALPGPVRRVLAATDFSATGDRAVARAISLVPRGGVLHLVHILHPHALPGGEFVQATIDPAFTQAHAHHAASLTTRLRALLPEGAEARGIATNVEVVPHRDPATGILQAAERAGADVICVGTHGGTGRFDTLLGSVSQQVVAHSLRPVLVVPSPRE
jgi:nucleotide-binding universal stress UspA family protein